jgi:tRNA-specific 2-thiouridylase
VADALSIPFYVWDVRDVFETKVVKQFAEAYASGNTPNPCVRCNEFVKFDYVLKRATALGFDALVTGHYAQIKQGPLGPELHRGVDEAKDQSYVLAVMSFHDLGRVIFPVGDTNKDEVRREASHRGFGVSAKPDSYDICFIPDGDTRAWLDERLGTQSGPVIDKSTGEQIATHQGIHTLTIGQRKGLRIDNSGGPFYVTAIDAAANTVVVGSAQDLDTFDFDVQGVNWLVESDSVEPTGADFCVQIRAHHRPVAGTVVPSADRSCARVTLREPVRGVAPGQTVVWYSGTRVIGCGTINEGLDRRA